MDKINLQYPLGSYSIENPPSNSTLMGDLDDVQQAINTGSDDISALQTSKLDASSIDTDVNLTGNSDVKVASQKAVKAYVDTTEATINTSLAAKASLGGWETSEAATFVSNDGATGVFNIASDVTGKYSPGMRYSYQQSQALTAYWSMDTNSVDAIGGFNGTDTAMSYTAGKFSNAATFNGTTSKIVIADNAALKPTGEFTIGCWFKTGTTGTNKFLFQSWTQNTNKAGIRFFIGTSNTLQVHIGNNTGTVAGVNSTELAGTTVVTDNAFHYAVISFRNNFVQVYLDGKLEFSSYCLAPAYAATNYVRIGCGNDSGSDITFMNGQIDDLFLINGYALDQATVAAKYAAATAQGTGAITVQKYGLITAVGAFSGGNTPITIWGGTDYSLQNAAITSPYYATVSKPFGFPQDKNKWKVELLSTVKRQQNSPVSSTWYNAESIVIPIGNWDCLYEATLECYIASTGNRDVLATFSNANNSELDKKYTTWLQVLQAYGMVGSVSKSFPLTVSAKTTYYLNYSTNNGGSGEIDLRGDTVPTIIRAVSAYL